jgi:hypothetical protein
LSCSAQPWVLREGDLFDLQEANTLRNSDPDASGITHLGLGQPHPFLEDQLLLFLSPRTGQGQ